MELAHLPPAGPLPVRLKPVYNQLIVKSSTRTGKSAMGC